MAIEGYLAARAQHGSPDALADRLFEWLRERGEHPPEGWETKLRRDFQGDESAGIRKFLDLATEFARLPRADDAASPCQASPRLQDK